MTSGAVPADLDERLRRAATAECVLFATDFDGVLAPLGDDPMAVRPVDGAMDTLRRAASLPGVTVAIVSGRDLDSLSLLTGVAARAEGDDNGPGIVLIGSHGGQGSRPDLLEHPPLTDDEAQRLQTLTDGLERIVRDHPDARIERKPAAVVLHTRGTPPEAGRSATRDALTLAEGTPGTYPLPGKDVVELAVTDVTKGSALRAVAATLGAGVTCYFGDDVTDETVFSVLGPDDVGVKVGPGSSAAVCRVSDEVAVVAAFEVFVRAREADAASRTA